jgi:hypothetical protein
MKTGIADASRIPPSRRVNRGAAARGECTPSATLDPFAFETLRGKIGKNP